MPHDDNCPEEFLPPDQEVFTGRGDQKAIRGDRCSPVEIVPPDEFVLPDGTLTPVVPGLDLPPVLVIGNAEITVDCSDIAGQPPEGAPFSVTIETGKITENFDWRLIPGITPNRLNHIAYLDPADRAQALTFALDPDFENVVEDMRSLYKLPRQQLQFIYDTIRSLAETLDQNALDQALSLLDCFWWNEEITVNCPVIDDVAAQGSGSSAAVAAETIRSSESQQDANDRAEARALSLLTCLYPNPEVTVYCHAGASPDPNLDFSEPVPGTLADPSAFGQIGEVTIAAGTVLAETPQRAEEIAIAQGLSLLECFYVSAEVDIECPLDINDESVVDIGPADPVTGQQGKTVIVPEGFFTSTTSTQEATDQATAYAESLLLCFWANDEKTASCTDEEYIVCLDPLWDSYDPISSCIRPLSPDESATKAAGGDSAWDAVVPAGSVTIFDPLQGKAAANEQAQILADAQLRCVYCNLGVDAECQIPGEEFHSPDATVGIPGGVICGTDAIGVQESADAIAAVPSPPPGADPELCLLCNKRLTIRCAPEEDTTDPWPTYEGIIEGLRTSEYVGFAFDITGQKMLPDSTLDGNPRGDPFELSNFSRQQLVVIQEGALCLLIDDTDPFELFEYKDPITDRYPGAMLLWPDINNEPEYYDPEDPDPETKAQASLQFQVLQLGLAQLECYWENPALSFVCEDDPCREQYATANPPISPVSSLEAARGEPYETPDGWTFEIGGEVYDDPSIDLNALYGFASGATIGALVPPGLFSSFNGPEEAEALAKIFGESQLDCFWESDEIRLACPTIKPESIKVVQQIPGDPCSPFSADFSDIEYEDPPPGDPPYLEYAPNAALGGVAIKGMFTSYEGKVQVNALASLFASVQLDCFYSNDAQSGGGGGSEKCNACDSSFLSGDPKPSPPPGWSELVCELNSSGVVVARWRYSTSVGWVPFAPRGVRFEGQVAEDTFTSYQSKSAANNMALQLAIATTECEDPAPFDPSALLLPSNIRNCLNPLVVTGPYCIAGDCCTSLYSWTIDIASFVASQSLSSGTHSIYFNYVEVTLQNMGCPYRLRFDNPPDENNLEVGNGDLLVLDVTIENGEVVDCNRHVEEINIVVANKFCLPETFNIWGPETNDANVYSPDISATALPLPGGVSSQVNNIPLDAGTHYLEATADLDEATDSQYVFHITDTRLEWAAGPKPLTFTDAELSGSVARIIVEQFNIPGFGDVKAIVDCEIIITDFKLTLTSLPKGGGNGQVLYWDNGAWKLTDSSLEDANNCEEIVLTKDDSAGSVAWKKFKTLPEADEDASIAYFKKGENGEPGCWHVLDPLEDRPAVLTLEGSGSIELKWLGTGDSTQRLLYYDGTEFSWLELDTDGVLIFQDEQLQLKEPTNDPSVLMYKDGSIAWVEVEDFECPDENDD